MAKILLKVLKSKATFFSGRFPPFPKTEMQQKINSNFLHQSNLYTLVNYSLIVSYSFCRWQNLKLGVIPKNLN